MYVKVAIALASTSSAHVQWEPTSTTVPLTGHAVALAPTECRMPNESTIAPALTNCRMNLL